jgi:predicted DNA-binding ribbon-helix-helix protein
MEKKKKSFTSIRIDPELWKEVKIEAIRRDMEVSELVELALRKELGLLRSEEKR